MLYIYDIVIHTYIYIYVYVEKIVISIYNLYIYIYVQKPHGAGTNQLVWTRSVVGASLSCPLPVGFNQVGSKLMRFRQRPGVPGRIPAV